MPFTPVQLARALLGTTSATLYTAAGNVIIKQVVLTNITATAATATINVAGVAICQALSIPANGVTVIDLSQIITNTQTVTGLAGTANAINAHISGVTF